MSLVAFKKKSVIEYGSKRSGKPPGGYWLSQGPFGANTTAEKLSIESYGANGFSINGGHRNVGYIGKSYQMSKMGTPFRGQYPCWSSGGIGGRYPFALPVFNVREVDTLGTQYKYIKPSTLSTRGMLEKKYRWAYTGQYPNYWVQPNYTGNQTNTASQGMYIHDISASNDCINDVNNSAKYEGHRVQCGPTDCYQTTALFKYNTMAANAPYTKTIRQPLDSSQQTLRIQRKCSHPVGAQKPFPFAVNRGAGIGYRGGLKVTAGNSGACSIANAPVYLAPPEWYIKSNIVNVET